MLIVHGGDGTVNEVVNGTARRGRAAQTGHVLRWRVVPGGSANVFARVAGDQPRPHRRDESAVDLLGEYRRTRQAWRRIGLMDCGSAGRCSRRAWAWTAMSWPPWRRSAAKGRRCHRVALHPRRGAARCWRSARRDPTLTLQLPGPRPGRRRPFRLRLELQPVDLCQRQPGVDQPRHRVRDGPRRVRHDQHERVGNLGLVRRMLSQASHDIKAKHLIRDDDVAWLQVTSDTPVAYQIDGDYIGLARKHAVHGGSRRPRRRRPPGNSHLTCSDQHESAARGSSWN